MMNEPISSIMTTDLISVGPNDSLDRVRAIFLSKRIHHVPVVEGNKLLGLMTTYDLFRLERSSGLQDVTAKDAMTTRLATLEPQQKIGVAAEVFLENLFHAIPIVKDGNLMGIITTFDLLKYNFKKAYPTQEI